MRENKKDRRSWAQAFLAVCLGAMDTMWPVSTSATVTVTVWLCDCDWPTVMDCNLELWAKINPLTPKLLWSRYFIPATGLKLRLPGPVHSGNTCLVSDVSVHSTGGVPSEGAASKARESYSPWKTLLWDTLPSESCFLLQALEHVIGWSGSLAGAYPHVLLLEQGETSGTHLYLSHWQERYREKKWDGRDEGLQIKSVLRKTNKQPISSWDPKPGTRGKN